MPDEPAKTFEQVTRKKISVPGKFPLPVFIDEQLPTYPVRFIVPPGHGTATPNVGSGWLMGSKVFHGSFAFQLTHVNLYTNTPNIWFALVHQGTPTQVPGGTVRTFFLESVGGLDFITDIYHPIETLYPGTMRFYALGAGSKSTGKGSTSSFRGVGSIGKISISANLRWDPV